MTYYVYSNPGTRGHFGTITKPPNLPSIKKLYCVCEEYEIDSRDQRDFFAYLDHKHDNRQPEPPRSFDEKRLKKYYI